MSTVATEAPPPQRGLFLAAILVTAVLLALLVAVSGKSVAVFCIGLLLGFALYHSSFGFTAAYRRALLQRDLSGVAAQAVMLAAAILLFAPILAQGGAFGHGVSGSIAPVSLSMALGAFVFGIGMQLGGGCASGTLFTVGGGSVRMIVVLAFFCLGAFWGSLDLPWWSSLPSAGPISLSQRLGWEGAILAQLGALGLIISLFWVMGARPKKELWFNGGFSMERLIRGPWPLLFGAGLLALGNWLTLLVAGHAWSITWAFSLWAAKGAVLLGWDPATSGFWSGAFQQAALGRSLLHDTTSIMNFGIVLGAFGAAALAGKLRPTFRHPPMSLFAAVVGGLMMGYGARLAYGCNIGAFFSGVASASLHGWVWILCAIPGNVIGVRLRPLLGLSNGGR